MVVETSTVLLPHVTVEADTKPAVAITPDMI
jgi:hypothetical protein